jgi:proteasome beta subunit
VETRLHHLDPGSSFFDLLRQQGATLLPQCAVGGMEGREGVPPVPTGTTILALRYRGGALIAGDRQATEGYQVAFRRIEKVYSADDHSAIAIAGAAGPCIEMVRLFQTELAHYEKLESLGLSLEGKANRLAQMIRANLPLAIQGLIVVPIFVGYDLKRDEGRIYKFDVAGGRYEETDYYATGSGGKDARSSLKKVYRPGASDEEALRMGVEALYDAAEEDTATGGPDFIRRIFPSVKLVTREGIQDISEEQVASVCEAIVAARRTA